MNIETQLNDELLKQLFADDKQYSICLEEYKSLARMYAYNENAVAVLSDMKSNASYIYYGKVALKLGLGDTGTEEFIHSIWEDKILNRIHPDDLIEKQLQELSFFHFLKGIPLKNRGDYHIVNHIRMLDLDGVYIPVLHRMFYVAIFPNGSVWLALCLYNLSSDDSFGSSVVNTADGRSFELEKTTGKNLLSKREKEVLRLINSGTTSKKIAQMLSISTNTVNRHRQNILEKLQVNNSIEACRIAKGLKIL